jgi:MFS family permease
MASFVINLDTTLVNVALPKLTRELGATTAQLQWVVDAYNLVFAALLLTSGSLSDRFGRKGMLMAGLLVFGLASFAGGYATSPAELIAARAVMGLGAAMTFPATLSPPDRPSAPGSRSVWAPRPSSPPGWSCRRSSTSGSPATSRPRSATG